MRKAAFALGVVAVLGLATTVADAKDYGHSSSHRTVVALRHYPHSGHYYGRYPGQYGVHGHRSYYVPYSRYYGGYGCYGYPSYGYRAYGHPYYGLYYGPYVGFGSYGPRVGFSIGF